MASELSLALQADWPRRVPYLWPLVKQRTNAIDANIASVHKTDQLASISWRTHWNRVADVRLSHMP